MGVEITKTYGGGPSNCKLSTKKKGGGHKAWEKRDGLRSLLEEVSDFISCG